MPRRDSDDIEPINKEESKTSLELTIQERYRDPTDPFFRIFFGHSAFQFLVAGIESGIFLALHRQPASGLQELMMHTRLGGYSADILASGLKCLGLIVEEESMLVNCPAVTTLMQEGRWDLIEKWALFEAKIVYPVQMDFAKALKTGKNYGLKRIESDKANFYSRIAEDRGLSKIFYDYMGAWSREAGRLLFREVDFNASHTVLDVGGGDGTLAQLIQSKGSQVTLMDLPEICNIVGQEESGITLTPLDIFEDPWPRGFNRVVLAHQLVIWSPEKNRVLLEKARESLVDGGMLMIISSMRDDCGDSPFLSVMDLPYFASGPSAGGQIYRWLDYEAWLRELKFRAIQRVIPSTRWTPHGIILASK